MPEPARGAGLGDPGRLRARGEAIARNLPPPALKSRTLASAQAGTAGQRRAGAGEQFWEYRRHRPEDGRGRVDWRRSARSDALFVRESEQETARTVLFWTDTGDGMRWRGPGAEESKLEAAQIALISVGAALSRAGERIGLLGGDPAGSGARAVQRLAEGLCRPAPGLAPPVRPSICILASDFYEPASVWAERLSPVAARASGGVLLAVHAPAEERFPYSGRTRFKHPGTGSVKVFGRAETVAEAYREKFAANREELSALARRLGWSVVAMSSAVPPQESAGRLAAALAGLAAR